MCKMSCFYGIWPLKVGQGHSSDITENVLVTWTCGPNMKCLSLFVTEILPKWYFDQDAQTGCAVTNGTKAFKILWDLKW